MFLKNKKVTIYIILHYITLHYSKNQPKIYLNVYARTQPDQSQI